MEEKADSKITKSICEVAVAILHKNFTIDIQILHIASDMLTPSLRLSIGTHEYRAKAPYERRLR